VAPPSESAFEGCAVINFSRCLKIKSSLRNQLKIAHYLNNGNYNQLDLNQLFSSSKKIAD